MWVARDKDNVLTLYKNKPYRNGDYWTCDIPYLIIDESWFPELKWENEPLEVTLIPDLRVNKPSYVEF